MAIPDGKPATDFSAMNREWVRAVAKEAGGLPEVSGSDNGKVMTVVSGEWEAATPAASGIPAPADPSDGDVLTYDSTAEEWVAAAPGGGGGDGEILVCSSSIIPDDPDENLILNKTWTEIASAIANNIPVFAIAVYDSSPIEAVVELITNVYYNEGTGYKVSCATSDTTYFAAAASDYPKTNVGV